MKKIVSAFLVICLLLGAFTGCSDSIAAGKSAEIPNVSQNDILKIAKKYFNETKRSVENDLQNEFNRIIDWEPLFDGNDQDSEYSRLMSVDVAAAVTYYDSRNFNLALAAAVFDRDINSVSAAANLGTAIAAYYDRAVGDGDGSGKKEMVRDAAIVYQYAIKLSATTAGYTDSSLSPMVSLGNLYLDFGKNREALKWYETALKVDPQHKAALMGMESYYRKTRNEKKMLAMQAQRAKKPTTMGAAANKIDKQNEMLEEGADLDGSELEAFTEKMSEVNAITLADYFEAIDPGTAKKVRDTAKLAASQMDFAVPSADMVLQFSHFSHTGEPAFVAAVEVFSEACSDFYQSSEYQENLMYSMEDYSEILDGFGIDLTLDGMDLSEYVQEKLKNKGDDEAKVEASGLENASELVESLMNHTKQKDKKAAWADLAEMDPSYRIMTINPFDYANSYDILVQQQNMMALKNKTTIHKKNITRIIKLMMDGLNDGNRKLCEKVYPLMTEMGVKLRYLMEDYEGDDRDIRIHAVHKEYYPKINTNLEPIWGQTNEVVAVNYKKLEKYLPLMYKDCMQYIMLISDDEMRENEENALKAYLQESVQAALNYVLSAYSFPPKMDIRQCGCDTEELDELRERFEKDREKAAEANRRKQMQDRNDFRSGKLDENSELYQKIIKKYEYTTDLILLKYTHNEYKSTTSLNVWTPIAVLDYGKMENHFTGKTYVNADLEISGKADLEGEYLEVKGAELDMKAKFGFSYVQGKDGSIHPDDIDIRSAISASFSAGKFIDISASAEASAQRGLTTNASISLTGNAYLDDFKKTAVDDDMLDAWLELPDIAKPVWEGKYTVSADD